VGNPEKIRREIGSESRNISSNSHRGTFKKGATARLTGKPMSACPHRRDNSFSAVHYKYWRMGWESADRKIMG
jgi:hypothetical protein